MTNNGSAAGARRVCICDSEISYGEHLMEYLRREGRLPGDIYLYTGRETFLERETPETTGLLVIAESQYTEEIGKAGFKDPAAQREQHISGKAREYEQIPVCGEHMRQDP